MKRSAVRFYWEPAVGASIEVFIVRSSLTL